MDNHSEPVQNVNRPLEAAHAMLGVLFLFIWAGTAHATVPQASANYLFTAESLDGGGRRAVSADYAGYSSFTAGNFATSVDYAHRGGYVGQLNNAPVVTNYALTVVSNSTIKVPISALLGAAKDPDGDSISYVSAASASTQNGIVQRSGIWLLYKPPATFAGSDAISWVIRDSEGDQARGTILVQVVGPSPPPDGPTLNLISVTFNSAPGSTDATLRFASLPGETYLVQYCDDLTPPRTWTALGTASTTNGVFQIVDPTARNASQRFYRTVLQSP